MRAFVRELRGALRSLRRNPGFAGLAALTLALGIGANAAVFSVANAILLHPFSFPDADRLVSVLEKPPASALGSASHEGGEHRQLVPSADFEDLRSERGPWQSIAACGYADLRLAGAGDPEHIAGSRVSEEFFEVLGTQPELGRVFAAGEHSPGSDGEVVLSDGFWARRFGRNPAVLGSTITLDDRKYTVVGAMPKTFAYPPGGVDVWTPYAPSPEEKADRRTPEFLVVGRLRPGASLSQARSRLEAVGRRLQAEYPTTFAGRRFSAASLRDAHAGVLTPFVSVFEAAALFVLVIACVNVASLLMARGARRRREMAVRSALGAGRARLAGTVLAEWAILACAAGALALALARVALRLIRTGLPASIVKWVPGWDRIRLDVPALLFTLGMAVAAGVFFSLLPALRLQASSLTDGLGESSRSGVDPRRARAQKVLVVSQVALALVLLVGAALLLKGFRGLVGQYREFDPDGVVTLRIHLSEEKQAGGAQQAQFFDRVLAGLRSIPGVRVASLTRQVPADLGPIPAAALEVEGRPAVTAADRPLVDDQAISSEYFRSLRIPLRQGRDFRDSDAAGAPGAAIVSQELARRLWPGRDPIGRRIRFFTPSQPNEPWVTVVGVASDVKQYWSDRTPRLTVYRPYSQAPRPGMFAVLRATGDPAALLASARRAVWAVDPMQPVDEIRTMNGVVLESTAILRIAAGLLLVTGALALVLAVIGVGGLVAYNVSQRTREIGIRMALGARAPDVVRLVLRQGLVLSGLGLAFGLPVALAAMRLMGGLLYGMVSPDAGTIAGVGAALAAIAVGATYLPARRAASLDPVTALRQE